MQLVRSECVSAEQVAEIVMAATETKRESVSGMTARWMEMPSGSTIVLIEGLTGESLKLFH
jgi:hypothetical protein